MKVQLPNGKSYLVNGGFKNENYRDLFAGEVKEMEIVKFNRNNKMLELILGKSTLEEKKFQFLEEKILILNTQFEDIGIYYNLETKELKKDKEFSIDKIFKSKKIDSWQIDKYDECISFLLEVILNENPYVYNLFTEVTNKLIKFSKNLHSEEKYNVLNNLINSIDNLGNLEKISKSLGDDFIFRNIISESFELSESKKLSNVIELPMIVANGISKLKIESVYDDFKIIANTDPNNSILLINFILNFRKVFKSKMSKIEDIEYFVKNICKLMEFEEYSKSFKSLLNFLLNENFNYSNLSIPAKEAKELYDYYSIAQNMMEADKNLKLEKFPKNIQKHLNIIQQNNLILSNPRPDEFKDATSKYSFVEDSADEDYIFLYPKDELDLLEEGNILHHCVANYRDRIIDEGIIVVFMRKKGEESTPFVTIEYENGFATQMKEKFNEDVVDSDLIDSISRWSTRARKRERK